MTTLITAAKETGFGDDGGKSVSQLRCKVHRPIKLDLSLRHDCASVFFDAFSLVADEVEFGFGGHN